MQLPGSHACAAIRALGSATGDSRTTIIAENHACSASRKPSEAYRAVKDQVGLLHVFEKRSICRPSNRNTHSQHHGTFLVSIVPCGHLTNLEPTEWSCAQLFDDWSDSISFPCQQ